MECGDRRERPCRWTAALPSQRERRHRALRAGVRPCNVERVHSLGTERDGGEVDAMPICLRGCEHEDSAATPPAGWRFVPTTSRESRVFRSSASGGRGEMQLTTSLISCEVAVGVAPGTVIHPHNVMRGGRTSTAGGSQGRAETQALDKDTSLDGRRSVGGCEHDDNQPREVPRRRSRDDEASLQHRAWRQHIQGGERRCTPEMFVLDKTPSRGTSRGIARSRDGADGTSIRPYNVVTARKESCSQKRQRRSPDADPSLSSHARSPTRGNGALRTSSTESRSMMKPGLRLSVAISSHAAVKVERRVGGVLPCSSGVDLYLHCPAETWISSRAAWGRGVDAPRDGSPDGDLYLGQWPSPEAESVEALIAPGRQRERNVSRGPLAGRGSVPTPSYEAANGSAREAQQRRQTSAFMR